MRRVIVESPYAGDVERNVEFARRCVRDSLSRGEAPIASHLLYTQPGILNDDDAAERQWGIDAGLAWRTVAEASVVYTDLGISGGMRYGIAAAAEARCPIEFRLLAAKAYFVMDEHTLGYIDARQPSTFGILHASVLRGSAFDRLAGFTAVPLTCRLRPATHADFEDFRVSPEGHLSRPAS